MKKFLTVSAVALGLLSTTALADAGHAHGKEASGAGRPGESSKASRIVRVEMRDTMRFIPDRIKVTRGETIKFVVTNAGKVKHEMVLGKSKELKEHAEMMRRMPEMEHAEENQITVEPGRTAELVWQFTKAGMVEFACLIPGHFEAGMVGNVTVVAK